MATDDNPWAVETLDTYLFYCCPECDQKYKSKPSFVKHAFSSHPTAKETLKFEETTENIVVKNEMYIKEEYMEPLNEGMEDQNYMNAPVDDVIDHFYHDNLNWYESEMYELDEEPVQKKRKSTKLEKDGKL